LFHPELKLSLLESGNHFLNFKAYQYEGYDIQERKNLDKLSLKINVYYE
jgi:hypothetical protein